MKRVLCGILPAILPLVARWVASNEEEILATGLPLSENGIEDARLMGVRFPEKIRLKQVKVIPLPRFPFLISIGRRSGIVALPPAGMALRYGIFLRSDFWMDRKIVAHECVHTAQYERLGGIRPFLNAYFRECIESTYLEAPLEQEALIRSTEIHG